MFGKLAKRSPKEPPKIILTSYGLVDLRRLAKELDVQTRPSYTKDDLVTQITADCTPARIQQALTTLGLSNTSS